MIAISEQVRFYPFIAMERIYFLLFCKLGWCGEIRLGFVVDVRSGHVLNSVQVESYIELHSVTRMF